MMIEYEPAATEPEDTREYREGCKAYLDGKPSDSNPYPSQRGFNNMRYRWFVGWYSEKVSKLVE